MSSLPHDTGRGVNGPVTRTCSGTSNLHLQLVAEEVVFYRQGGMSTDPRQRLIIRYRAGASWRQNFWKRRGWCARRRISDRAGRSSTSIRDVCRKPPLCTCIIGLPKHRQSGAFLQRRRYMQPRWFSSPNPGAFCVSVMFASCLNTLLRFSLLSVFTSRFVPFLTQNIYRHGAVRSPHLKKVAAGKLACLDGDNRHISFLVQKLASPQVLFVRSDAG